MKPDGVSSGVPDVYSKLSPGSSSGCSPDHAGAVHVLRAPARVGDLPGAAEQLHRLAALVLDLHAIGPDEVVVVGLRLVVEVERAHGDADARAWSSNSLPPWHDRFAGRLRFGEWRGVVAVER